MLPLFTFGARLPLAISLNSRLIESDTMHLANTTYPVVLNLDEDGNYHWQIQGSIHKWLREQGYPHYYHFALMGKPSQRMMVIDFSDSDHAMICKLTWAEYVS